MHKLKLNEVYVQRAYSVCECMHTHIHILYIYFHVLRKLFCVMLQANIFAKRSHIFMPHFVPPHAWLSFSRTMRISYQYYVSRVCYHNIHYTHCCRDGYV